MTWRESDEVAGMWWLPWHANGDVAGSTSESTSARDSSSRRYVTTADTNAVHQGPE